MNSSEVLISQLRVLAERRGVEAKELAEDAGLPVSRLNPASSLTARSLTRSLEAELRELMGDDPVAPSVESILSGIDTGIIAARNDDRRGVFTVAPLDSGFGHTCGSILKRVLLSSLHGAAVTAVHFDGVDKGVGAPAGVREDFQDLVLNFKDLVLRSFAQEEQIEIPFSAAGVGEISAGDLEWPSGIEVLNPRAPIATLDRGEFKGSLLVTQGRGYASAEQNAIGLTNGFAPIEASFTPIRHASYEVTTARVGQRTDFDCLIIDLETDGSIDPATALREASRILIDSLSIFTDAERVRELLLPDTLPTAAVDSALGPDDDGPSEEILIEELDLGIRAYNCLKRAGIRTVGELVKRSRSELSAIPNLGERSIEEVRDALNRQGLGLRSS